MSSDDSVKSEPTVDESTAATDLNEVVLEVHNLSKTYRVFSNPYDRLAQAWADRRGQGPKYCFEVPAVNNISFELRRGAAISIIGRNGSGKSTLLEMIAGTLDPTHGWAKAHGRVSALLELGAGFNPDFTGRQNFRMSAAIQGLTDAEIRRVEPEVEQFAEVGPFFDEPVRTYSSGMYVRVAFASAVHVQPDLLIVDEALAVGDIFFQQKCFAYIEKNLQNTAKLIVTHDLASAVRLSQKCLVMDQGSVIFDGPPLEAVETFTALSLRERSSRLGSAAALPASAPSASNERAEMAAATPASNRIEVDLLPEVPVDRSSDSQHFAIPRAGVAVYRGGGWELVPTDSPIVRPGERLEFRFEARIGSNVDRPIFGYLVRDRVGNALFGQNSLGSTITLERLEPGSYYLAFEIAWPEVEQGEYTLTLGLGDGAHPLHHDIVAWAQSVLALHCLPSRPVHGMFNNDITSMSMSPISDVDDVDAGVDAGVDRVADAGVDGDN